METNSVNTVQEIINERAKKRLDNDITNLQQKIQSEWKLLDYFREFLIKGDASYYTLEEVVKKTRVLLFDKHIEKYIKEETDMFVNEYQEIKERLNRLENKVEYGE